MTVTHLGKESWQSCQGKLKGTEAEFSGSRLKYIRLLHVKDSWQPAPSALSPEKAKRNFSISVFFTNCITLCVAFI